MTVAIIIDILVIAVLVSVTITKGFERALPYFVFVTVLLPVQAKIVIFDIFALSGQRVAIVTLVALYLIFKKQGAQVSPLETTPLKFLLMLHIAWCLISTANSIVPGDSFKKLLYEVFEYYAMYYIFIKTITQVKTIHRIMGAVVCAVFVACVFGAIEAYSGWRVTSLFPPLVGRFSGTDERFTSTFANYSLFGAAISFAVVDALYLLTLAKTRTRKVYLWFALVIMFLNIYKVVTRGPWLALILGCALLLFIGTSVTRKQIVVLAALSIAVMIVRPGVYQTVKNLYLETVDTSNPGNIKGTSYEYRYALWRISVNALQRSTEREVWGYGLESFFALHLTGPFYDNPDYPFESCDSSWTELTVETGFVGLVIIAILLLKPAVLAFRDWRKLPKPDSYLSGTIFINMVQYFFMMTNVALYGWGQTAYMLWMWIAIAMVYKHVLQNEMTERLEADPVPEEADLERVAATPSVWGTACG